MELFAERGYDAVTVADIAEKASLTKRSFFNHFTDKREVVFASADAFQEAVLSALAETDAGLDALDAAVEGFTRAAERTIAGYPELALTRQRLIGSSLELQERDLVKTAALNAAVAGALTNRGVPIRDAAYVAQAASMVFTSAVNDWAQHPGPGLAAPIQTALRELRSALSAGPGCQTGGGLKAASASPQAVASAR
jgi:AcrR family transcriptional regulator